jgi:hypothetical protein
LEKETEMQKEIIKIYMAGPLHGSGFTGHNIHKVVTCAEYLDHVLNRLAPDKDFLFIVPHLYEFWDMITPKVEEYWLAKDRLWMETADILVRLSGESPGADKEQGWATELGIPTYCEEDCADWQEIAERIVDDFNN